MYSCSQEICLTRPGPRECIVKERESGSSLKCFSPVSWYWHIFSVGGVGAKTNKYIWAVIGTTNTTFCKINFQYKKIGLFSKLSFTFQNTNQHKRRILSTFSGPKLCDWRYFFFCVGRLFESLNMEIISHADKRFCQRKMNIWPLELRKKKHSLLSLRPGYMDIYRIFHYWSTL